MWQHPSFLSPSKIIPLSFKNVHCGIYGHFIHKSHLMLFSYIFVIPGSPSAPDRPRVRHGSRSGIREATGSWHRPGSRGRGKLPGREPGVLRRARNQSGPGTGRGAIRLNEQACRRFYHHIDSEWWFLLVSVVDDMVNKLVLKKSESVFY